MKIAIIGILLIAGLAYAFGETAIALGWLFGWFGVALLRIVRHYSHREIGRMLGEEGEQFSKLRYGLLIFGTLLVIAIPLLLAFYFRDIMNPFAAFIAYFLERFWNLVQVKRQTKVEEG